MDKRLTIEKGLKILQDYGTPPHVQRHCLAVAKTASLICRALNEHGYELDVALAEGAGVLHDIARVEKDHWKRGADIVRELGYEEEAEIIGKHMTYTKYSPLDKINETDIVCIADRIVKENRYVGIDERIEYIANKALKQGYSEEEAQAIRDRMNISRIFVSELEKIIGRSMDDLCGGVNEEI